MRWSDSSRTKAAGFSAMLRPLEFSRSMFTVLKPVNDHYMHCKQMTQSRSVKAGQEVAYFSGFKFRKMKVPVSANFI